MSRELRHYESVGKEIEEIRRLAAEFISKTFSKRFYEAEKKINEVLITWNIVRDYYRWLKDRDEEL
ncbi:hypothetical protein ACSU1N_07080 [Thermogladius sp. 4427co]|uniref:hypothetical protein n=1 Tax=Thermogladius sp. 4427co TaxID=3450718 RepID=UPI003F78BF86